MDAIETPHIAGQAADATSARLFADAYQPPATGSRDTQGKTVVDHGSGLRALDNSDTGPQKSPLSSPTDVKAAGNGDTRTMLTVMPSLDALNAPQMTAMQTVHPDGSSNIVEQTAEKGGTVVSSVELHSANSARGADTVVTFDAKTGKPNQVLTAGADVSLDPSTGKTRQVVEIPPVGSGQPVATVSFDSQTGKPSEVKLLNPNGADSTFKIDPTTGKATAEPSNDPQSRNDLLSWIKGW